MKRIVAAFVFLVHFHQLEPALAPRSGAPHRQAGGLTSARMPLDRGALDVAQAQRQVGRHHHAAADRFAVQPFAVADARLDRVAEGVAEIEDGAQAALALVLAHDVGLDFAGARDRMRQRGRVARQQLVDVLLDPVEERRRR